MYRWPGRAPTRSSFPGPCARSRRRRAINARLTRCANARARQPDGSRRLRAPGGSALPAGRLRVAVEHLPGVSSTRSPPASTTARHSARPTVGQVSRDAPCGASRERRDDAAQCLHPLPQAGRAERASHGDGGEPPRRCRSITAMPRLRRPRRRSVGARYHSRAAGCRQTVVGSCPACYLPRGRVARGGSWARR
jgi:hypothetical protein